MRVCSEVCGVVIFSFILDEDSIGQPFSLLEEGAANRRGIFPWVNVGSFYVVGVRALYSVGW